jgi:hypothetical protein
LLHHFSLHCNPIVVIIVIISLRKRGKRTQKESNWERAPHTVPLSNCRNDDGDEEARSSLSHTTAHCPPSSDFFFLFFFWRVLAHLINMLSAQTNEFFERKNGSNQQRFFSVLWQK